MSERGLTGRVNAVSVATGLLVTVALLGRRDVFGVPEVFGPDERGLTFQIIALVTVILLTAPLWLAGLTRIGGLFRQLMPLALVAVLLFGVAVSTIWAPVGPGASYFALSLLTLVLMLFVYALLLAVDPAAGLRSTLWTIILVGLALTAVGLASGGGADRLAVLGGGPNVYGRNVALAVVAAVALLLRRQMRSVGWLATVLMVIALILSGSRGATIACLGGLLVVVLLSGVTRSIRVAVVSVGVVLVFSLFSENIDIVGRVSQVFSERYIDLLLEQQYSAGRDVLLSDGIGLVLNRPIWGWGNGAFSALYGEYTYPHNLVIETGIALGAIGIMLLLMTMASAVANLWRFRAAPLSPALMGGLVVAALASMFSGDMFDSRFLWFFAVAASFADHDAGVLRSRSTEPNERDGWRPTRIAPTK